MYSGGEILGWLSWRPPGADQRPDAGGQSEEAIGESRKFGWKTEFLGSEAGFWDAGGSFLFGVFLGGFFEKVEMSYNLGRILLDGR
jgi:hypothetical protein